MDEASTRLKKASTLRSSYEWRTRIVAEAVRARFGTRDADGYVSGAWVIATTESDVVFELSGKNGEPARYFRVPYTIDEKTDAVAFLDPVEVEQTFVDVTKEVRILRKTDGARRLTYGVVLAPDVEDAQGDVVSAEDIEAAAHEYLAKSRQNTDSHKTLVGAEVVESYIAPTAFELAADDGTVEKIDAGSWVMVVRWDEPTWAKIEKGELNAYSIGGTGVRIPIER